jgi:hypothetical protein
MLQGAATVAAFPKEKQQAPRPQHPFEAWEAQRAELEHLLDLTPESNEPLRDRLFDRSVELEDLIFKTPSSELPAILVKARLLVWLMQMDGCDGLVAMCHIHDYLHQIA